MSAHTKRGANLFGEATRSPYRVHKGSRRGPPRFLKIGADKGESARERGRYWRHARRLNIGPGLERRYGGALGSSPLLVFNALLYKFHNTATGRCDPSYEAIAAYTGLGRSTVAAALVELERRGMIEHDRRVYEKETVPGSRWEMAQDSNVYRLLAPERWKRYDARETPRTPPPDDDTIGKPDFVLDLRPEIAAAQARGATRRELITLMRRGDADPSQRYAADALERAERRAADFLSTLAAVERRRRAH